MKLYDASHKFKPSFFLSNFTYYKNEVYMTLFSITVLSFWPATLGNGVGEGVFCSILFWNPNALFKDRSTQVPPSLSFQSKQLHACVLLECSQGCLAIHTLHPMATLLNHFTHITTLCQCAVNLWSCVQLSFLPF